MRTVWSGKVLAAGTRSWTWDGRLANGTYAPQGLYTARLVVQSSLSTQGLSQSVWAAAFAVRPSATTVKAGQTLTLAFSSIEGVSGLPRVAFTQPGRAAVTVTATRLANGSFRASFKVASGSAGTASVKISAKDSKGGTNTMVVPITVSR